MKTLPEPDVHSCPCAPLRPSSTASFFTRWLHHTAVNISIQQKLAHHPRRRPPLYESSKTRFRHQLSMRHCFPQHSHSICEPVPRRRFRSIPGRLNTALRLVIRRSYRPGLGECTPVSAPDSRSLSSCGNRLLCLALQSLRNTPRVGAYPDHCAEERS